MPAPASGCPRGISLGFGFELHTAWSWVMWSPRFPWQHQSPAANPPYLESGAGGRSASSPAMPRGPRPRLWLLLLPLLLRPLSDGLGPHDTAGPGEAAEEAGSGPAWRAFQGLRERLRAAGALSKRYWALFACRVWPEACAQDKEGAAWPQGKTGACPPCRVGSPPRGAPGSAEWGAAVKTRPWFVDLRVTWQDP